MDTSCRNYPGAINAPMGRQINLFIAKTAEPLMNNDFRMAKNNDWELMMSDEQTVLSCNTRQFIAPQDSLPILQDGEYITLILPKQPRRCV
jgi:hypothetical protein